MLTREISYFNKIQPELKAKHPDGGYVVIKDEVMLGIWKDREDAIKQGVEKYGIVSFLVKDIFDDPNMTINFSRKLNFA